jgi:DNA-binding NarL/FixJ family response regulator
MNEPALIRVALVEDDQATRQGLVNLLRHAAGIVCVATYGSAEEAERGIPALMPDVVLMDINLPGRSGIECVFKLKQTHPRLHVLILTTYGDSEQIFGALRAGASGYLLKRADATELVAAIMDVYSGGSPMSGQIARKVISFFQQNPPKEPDGDLARLTAREQTILASLSKGKVAKEIATELDISTKTVRNHLHEIYRKLHVQSRTEAVLKYLGH